MVQEYTQAIKALIAENLRDAHTAVPGKILKFDPAKCEASIQPTAKFRKPDGETLDFPQIHEVPVYFPQSASQGVTFTYRIEPGDECLLIFLEQALDQWRTGAESDTELRFDLANCVAIPGLFAKVNPHVKRADENKSIIIRRDDSYVEIYGTTGQIDVYATGDINVESEKNINVTAAIDVNITANANMNIKSTGPMTITSGTSIEINAPRIDLNNNYLD
jgi:hypothetical protein